MITLNNWNKHSILSIFLKLSRNEINNMNNSYSEMIVLGNVYSHFDWNNEDFVEVPNKY